MSYDDLSDRDKAILARRRSGKQELTEASIKRLIRVMDDVDVPQEGRFVTRVYYEPRAYVRAYWSGRQKLNRARVAFREVWDALSWGPGPTGD